MRISPQIIEAMLATWENHGDPLRFALLETRLVLAEPYPVPVDGVWPSDLSDWEVQAEGYTRGELDLSAIGDTDSGRRVNLFAIQFGANESGGNVIVTHVAVLNADEDSVLSVVTMFQPLTVLPGQVLTIRSTELELVAA